MSRISFLLIVLACAAWGQRPVGLNEVTGTVSYREKIALPADAVITVELYNVTNQKKPAKLVADVRIPSDGKQVPFEFKLTYRRVDVSPDGAYIIRAFIAQNDTTLFNSVSAYPVITRGAPNKVAMLMTPAQASTVK